MTGAWCARCSAAGAPLDDHDGRRLCRPCARFCTALDDRVRRALGNRDAPSDMSRLRRQEKRAERGDR